MRFREIRIGSFGGLRDTVLGTPRPLDGLVAVLGPNEAGKSTIQRLLTTLLYGFRPATRDTHPYTPWDGGDIDISADIEMDDGHRITVQRRLPGRPSGHLIHGHDVTALDNRSLPEVDHLGRGLFDDVYAITLAQLASLGESAWPSVQDELVTGLGAHDLRPPRRVSEELDEAAKRLWRSDQRGKPRSKAIGAAISEAAAERRRAVDRDRELRAIRGELSEFGSGLEEAHRAVTRARDRRRAVLELLPLRRELEALDRLGVAVRDPDALGSLPRDPVGVGRELRGRVERAEGRLAELSQTLATVRRTMEGAAAERRLSPERVETLESLLDQRPLLVEWSGRRKALDREIERLDATSADRLPRVWGWSAEVSVDRFLAGVRVVDAEGLADAVDRLEAARRAARDDAGAGDGGRQLGLARRAWPTVLAGLAAMLAFAFGLSLAQPLLWGPAGLLLAGLFVRAALTRETREPEGAGPGAWAPHEREVRSLLEPLGDGPGEPLVAGIAERIEAVQSLLRDRDARAAERDRLRSSSEELRARLLDAVEGLEWDLPAELAAAMDEARLRLEEDHARKRALQEARSEAGRLEALIERETAERDAAREALRGFEAAVERAGGSPDEDGLALLGQRISDLDQLGRVRREFAGRPGGVEGARQRLHELERELRDDGADLDIETADTEVESLEMRIREIERRKSGLEERERNLLAQDTPDVIDGRIVRLQVELEEARREHDRLWVLARVLDKAEERFRSERQPGLLRQARLYLDRITGGRYGRILVGDRGVQDGFLLDATHLPEPHPIEEPISAGTREQVYLSLRLAIADHLDQGRESLPLLMDEVLVNWDPERRARALTLLAEKRGRRQIFLFTCHPSIAEEVRAAGGTLVDLSRGANGGPSDDTTVGPRAGPESRLPVELRLPLEG